MKELKVKAIDENLTEVLDMVENFLEGQCSQEVKNEILISIDELFINIAHYAYGEEVGDAAIRLELLAQPKRLKITMIDQGIPFNPLEKEAPDIDLTLEERKIGGLGIFMVKDYMDHLEYFYQNNSNTLILEKNLSKND
ncbi:MAG: ATP-binding protein [Lachnospiraceae bacterium]|nr:ATP-binding protein [Lachnospiraceae bacterium]